MIDDKKARTIERYRAQLQMHGNNYRALDWGSREGQLLRFQILCEIGNLAGSRVLDVGCGLGDLAAWLEERNLSVDYTGLELTPELLAEAERLHPSRRFIQGSVLDPDVLAGESFDYVFASGIFYSYPEDGDAWLEAAVTQMWQWARIGLAFNTLSVWAEHPEPGEYYADPARVLTFCHRLSPWVALRHDYHPRDFSIYMRRRSVAA